MASDRPWIWDHYDTNRCDGDECGGCNKCDGSCGCARCDGATPDDGDGGMNWSEAELQGWLIEAITKRGGTARRHQGNKYSGSLPDLTGILYGRRFSLELKTLRGALHCRQEFLRRAGKIEVLWGADEMLNWLWARDDENAAWQEAIAA